MIHEWERQDKMLDRVEKTDIGNCLDYKQFKYEKQEWDNIPGIVPRYVIYLAKYVEGLSGYCNEFQNRETVSDLRDDIQNQIDKMTNNFINHCDNDGQQKTKINDTIKDHKNQHDKFKKAYEHFTHEATKLNEGDCSDTFRHSMDVVMETKGQMEHDEEEKDTDHYIDERHQMRMYSFKQLFNLFTMVNNRSEVHDRLCTAEE